MAACRMSDASLEDEQSSGDLASMPNICTAPIPEVEAVLRTADHWHFDAFRLTEVSQGYPLSTLGFWLIQQNRVAKEFSESSHSHALLAAYPRKSESSHLHALLAAYPSKSESSYSHALLACMPTQNCCLCVVLFPRPMCLCCQNFCDAAYCFGLLFVLGQVSICTCAAWQGSGTHCGQLSMQNVCAC